MSESQKSNFYHYNYSLKKYAKQNRNSSTKAEACLWKHVLRDGKMNGYRFLRQRPVLDYIADFMCKELKLIIEVDGITHSYEDAAMKDINRQKDLENAGFKVLRYTDEEVLTAINRVRDQIEDAIEIIKKR